jgi:Ca2+-binding RTX toxin-like protein
MYGATDHADFLAGNRLFYNGRLDTYSGQSGSGIWVEEGGQRHIIGVHTSGGQYFNAGTALTPEIHRQVVSWINDDGDPIGVTATVPGGATMAITGTDGSDNIVGTPGNDLIRLLGGDDACRAGDGGDLIYGNAGRDVLEGDGGNDTLFGGRDGDTLSGNAGADLIYGNLADDVLFGGTGVDTLYGGQGQDRLLGGDGDDVLYAGAGDDILYGDNTQSSTGAGNDTLYGGSGTDTAVYLFGRANYRIQGQADGSILIGDSERLYGIEILRFADGDVPTYLFV